MQYGQTEKAVLTPSPGKESGFLLLSISDKTEIWDSSSNQFLATSRIMKSVKIKVFTLATATGNLNEKW